MAQWVRNLPANAGDVGDAGLILSSWYFPGQKKWATAHFGILARKIP